MRQILALAFIAAGLHGLAAANEPPAAASHCTTYLMGVWKLETDGDPVTVIFGTDDNFKKTTPAGDEWGKWNATDDERMDSCHVKVVGSNGRDQHVVFKAVDENTFSYESDIYRRQRNTDETTYQTNAAHAFDTTTCPTYFVGEWTYERIALDDGRVRTAIFQADGVYIFREETPAADGAPGESRELTATWSAAPGVEPGFCLMTIATPGKKPGQFEWLVKDENTFISGRDGATYRRK